MVRGPESPRFRIFEQPFQLWDDLGCRSLTEFHPITQAAHDARVLKAQRRMGIVPLAECHEEPPRG